MKANKAGNLHYIVHSTQCGKNNTSFSFGKNSILDLISQTPSKFCRSRVSIWLRL